MRALVPLAAAALVALDPGAAHAYRIGAGTFAGGGVANPGIGLVPTANALAIGGDATLYGPYGSLTVAGFDNGRVVGCQLLANGTESTAAAFGVIYGNCGPVPFDRCTYVRAVAAMTVVCANGTTAEWVFSPMAGNPALEFTLTGTSAYVIVP